MNNYYGRDLPEIRSKLIERIKLTDPTLTQFTGSDPGMILIDSVSAIADELNYYIDRARLENYISSCTQEDSLIRLAKLTSYFIKGVQPPSVELSASSDLNKSISRIQLYFDGIPYCIIDPVVLNSTNGRESQVLAYNGELKTIWVSVSSLDLTDPKFILGKSVELSKVGMEVSLELNGTIVTLTNSGWFATKTINGTVEISIRDNRIQQDGATKVLVKFISIKEEDFKALDVGVTLEDSTTGITFTTLSGSTTGSGPESYETARRNIVNSNRLYSPVSVYDFQAIAEEDLEVAKAISFDWNTPSITDNPDEVQTFILLTSQSATLSDAVISRLNKAVRERGVILGMSYYWNIALMKVFNLVINVYTFATDMVLTEPIEEAIRAKYSANSFGQRITLNEIESLVNKVSSLIEYSEVISPSATVITAVNEVPILGDITINIMMKE